MGVSGNYGQLDLVAALQWVQKSIAAFGGDPNKVAIYGQSGGGQKVNGLMCSPLTEGLFRGAIAHSTSSGGSILPASGVPLEEAETVGDILAGELGVSTLEELRALPWQEIITVSRASGSGYTDLLAVDGWSLQDTIRNTFQAGMQQDVPYIWGMCDYDSATLFNGSVTLAQVITQRTSNIYAYLFMHVPTGWEQEGVRAYHTIDIPYVMGDLSEIERQWERYAVPQGSTNPDPGFDWEDEFLVEAMQAMWIQFAATGNPNVKGLVSWSPYRYNTDQYLQIDVPLEVKSGFSELVHEP